MTEEEALSMRTDGESGDLERLGQEPLARITAHTSKEEVYTRPSTLNPYPEKARTGLFIWLIQNSTTNPLIYTKYGTGEVYRGSIPLSYENELKEKPQPLESEPEKIGDRGEWISFEDYWVMISEDLIRSEAFSERVINEAVESVAPTTKDHEVQLAEQYLRWAQSSGPHSKEGKFYHRQYLKYAAKAEANTRFRSPAEIHKDMLLRMSEAAELGDWRAVFSIGDYGFNIGSYEIDGEKVDNFDLGLFPYLKRFAVDVYPQIYGDGEVDMKLEAFKNADRENWQQYSAGDSWHISGLIRGILINEMKLKALERGLDKETDEELVNKLVIVRDRLQDRRLKLMESLQEAQECLGRFAGIEVSLDDLLEGLKGYLVN